MAILGTCLFLFGGGGSLFVCFVDLFCCLLGFFCVGGVGEWEVGGFVLGSLGTIITKMFWHVLLSARSLGKLQARFATSLRITSRAASICSSSNNNLTPARPDLSLQQKQSICYQDCKYLIAVISTLEELTTVMVF